MRLLLALSLLALASVCSAQDAKAIDSFVESLMKKNGVPGLSLAVVRDGKLAYVKGYGFADIENSVPATPDTVYEIGSVTKQFTAALVLQQVEEGKLKLDEPVRTYMPDLPEAWKAVTIRHLLTHTSGIKSYTDVPAFYPRMRDPAGDGAFLSLVGKVKLDFEPGTDWKYDNSGYFLLGMLIEKVAGKSYRDTLQERIFRPLGMTHTDLNDWQNVVKNRARGYVARPNADPTNATYVDMSWPFAAGAMISTAVDMAKWDAALYTDKILKQATWTQVWTPVTLSNGTSRPYGFGWALGEMNGATLIDHAGAINGFNADISRVPSKKLTVIVMCNAFPGGIAEPVARKVLGLADPSLVTVYKAIADPDPGRAASHKTLLESLVKGTASKEAFTDEMQKRLFPNFVDQVHGLLADHGGIESFILMKLETTDGVERREYHAVLGGQGLKMMVATNAAGKISGFSLQLD